MSLGLISACLVGTSFPSVKWAKLYLPLVPQWVFGILGVRGYQGTIWFFVLSCPYIEVSGRELSPRARKSKWNFLEEGLREKGGSNLPKRVQERCLNTSLLKRAVMVLLALGGH